MKVQCKYIPGG